MAEDFGSFPRDDNNNTIHVGTALDFQDAAGSPISSPYAVPDGNEFSLTAPSDAAELVMWCTEDIRVGKTAGMADGYWVLPKNTIQAFSMARLDTIFLDLDSASSATLNFYFVLV